MCPHAVVSIGQTIGQTVTLSGVLYQAWQPASILQTTKPAGAFCCGFQRVVSLKTCFTQSPIWGALIYAL